jgi:hypothetical protein
MITTVWWQLFVVWSERNATVHGNTHATRQEALCRKITREIHQWFYRKDQLLQSDRIDILEAKFGPTIDTANTQIAKDPPHVSLNWLCMYNPILHDGIKLATATALQGVRQMSTYFPTVRQASNKRPPKPRYSGKHHTRFDSHNRVRRKTQSTARGTQSILPFQPQPNLPRHKHPSRPSAPGVTEPGSHLQNPPHRQNDEPAQTCTTHIV